MVQWTRLRRRGFQPDASTMLWYDPAAPERATRFGPGSWAIALVLCLAALGWVFTHVAVVERGLSLLAR